MEQQEKVVSRETLKRVISDISEVVKNPLHSHGIYYEHDEENILKGYVLVIPQNSGSPYRYGNYLFSVDFPTNYPYSPPKMNYLTNNGNTRFHPNLYRNGKVCLSLLNTWKGEQWTSCNTLSSILLNIATLFTDKPFLHEPGINEQHESFADYTKVIKHQNIKTSIYGVLTNSSYLDQLNGTKDKFRKTVDENYRKNAEEILKTVEEEVENGNGVIEISIPFYKMYDEINYKNLYLKLKEFNNKVV